MIATLKNRTLSRLLMTLLLSCSVLSSIAYDFKVDNIYYNILSESKKRVEVTFGGISDAYTGDIIIPGYIEHNGGIYTVTRIRPETFWGCTGLTGITLPTTIPTIEDYTFYGCSGLKEIKLPENITSIGNYAFHGCSSLESIRIPDSVTSLGKSAFESSGLKQIEIGTGITSIPDGAFRLCGSLTSITIPDNITSIGNSAFEFCTKLGSAKLGKGVDRIGDCAFMGCSLLPEIFFPDGLTRIGALAFEGCSNLSSIKIPYSVTTIGESAFDGCSGFTSIAVEGGNSSYYDKGCAIIEAADNRLVHGCKNTVIPDGVTSIGKWAFYNCAEPTNIIMPESIRDIEEFAFFKCIGLTGIIIPQNTVTIGKYAFYQCSRLQSVTIPAGMKSIGDGAFFECKEIGNIYSHSKRPASIEERTFDGIHDTATLYVPTGTKEIYQAAPYWCNFTNIIEKDFGNSSDITPIADDDENTHSHIYDLQGRQVKQMLKGGIYIRNGKATLYQ